MLQMQSFVEKNIRLKEFLAETSMVSGFLWEKGFSEKNAGNISANITSLITNHYNELEELKIEVLESSFSSLAGMYFFVTAKGKRMRDISKDIFSNSLIIRISDDGKSYTMYDLRSTMYDLKNRKSIDRGTKSKYEQLSTNNEQLFRDIEPTSELLTYLFLHKEMIADKSGNTVILHTHPTELITLTHDKNLKNEKNLNKILWSMQPETMLSIHEGVGFIPYMSPGSMEIAIATVEKAKKYNFIIWDKHGAFSIGKNILDVFDTLDVVNKSASIYLKCKSAGIEPEYLSDKELADLKSHTK